jgi:hypothetical protein
MQSLYNAYATATPSQKMAAAARHMRLAKINKAAAKAKVAELCPIEPEPVEVIEPVDPIKEWVERQRAIPIKKKPWFFVEKDLGPVVHRPPAVDEIITATARHFKFSLTDLMACRRLASVVRARQVAMYLTKVLTTRSFPEIGRRFGGRDHTTVLHAVRKIERLRQIDTGLEMDLRAIVAAVGGSFDH